MRSRTRYFTTLFAAAGACAAIAAAPRAAAAAPECVNTGPNTTQCQSNGNAQIVTSPPANNYYPYWGFPIIGFGGLGLGGCPRSSDRPTDSANLTFLFDNPDRRWVRCWTTPRCGCARVGSCSGLRS